MIYKREPGVRNDARRQEHCICMAYYRHLSAIALIKSSLFSTTGFSIDVINARSFVICPLSIVSTVAFSSLSAKSINS